MTKILCLLFLLSSCHSYHYGYNFDTETECTGKIGITTKSDILEIFGSPTIEDDNKLFYISRKDTKFLFISHILPKQKSCMFEFDSNDKLLDVK